MSLHECQDRQLFAEYGLPVSRGFTVNTPEGAAEACDRIGGSEWVAEAQVHAGGRGKAGGVKLVKSKKGAKVFVQQWLGRNLVTYQTDAGGQPVSRILAESCTDIDKELYLGAVVDRFSRRIMFMAPTEGGVDIEKAAHDTSEGVPKVTIDPLVGARPYRGHKLVFQLDLKGDQARQLTHVFAGLAKLLQDYDLALLEMNLLVIKKDGNLHYLGTKINIDSNTPYRQPKLRAVHSPSQDDTREVHAQKWELNYIALEGNIDCMVSDVGLATNTMDIVNLHDNKPANSLDAGSGTTKERVTEAFRTILLDSNVKAVPMDIFGGIVCHDMVAEGIIGAAREVGAEVLIVVRLEGNNVELDAKVLVENGLSIIAVTSLTDAAQQVVKAAEGK